MARCFRPRRAVRDRVPRALLVLSALLAAPLAAQDPPRLLTGLSAEPGPEGVALAWTVDESRADRIAGFSCVYRTPGHLKTGVSGAVPCGPDGSPADARERTVAGLPEYGEYLFEIVAQETSGAGIPWPRRALNVTVAVTEDLAGPAGPGRAVTGAGPLVEDCGPDDSGPRRPWCLDQVVSAEHLSHPPGLGWVAGGDSAAPPDWPEPPPFRELISDARLDLTSPADSEPDALAAAARAVLARAGRTKALLRAGPDGGHELKLHSSYPFGAAYAYAAGHAVPGWGRPADPVAWPRLYNRTSCPPPESPDATHDVALALSDAAGDGRRRLWTPLDAGADRAAGWPAQAVLVAGFGAVDEAGRP